MKKIELKTNEKGWIYMREDRVSLDQSFYIELYANDLNQTCIPLLDELGLNTDIKNVIRYSCIGGIKRIETEYIKEYEDNMMMKQLALSNLKVIMSRHPEFKEIANKWKWANFLKLTEDGQVVIDTDKYQESREVWIKDPVNIKFIKEKVVPAIEMLNNLFDESQIGDPSIYILHSSIICWKSDIRRFDLNNYKLTDRAIKVMLMKKSEYNPDKLNEQIHQKALEQEFDTMVKSIKDFGLSEFKQEIVDDYNSRETI